MPDGAKKIYDGHTLLVGMDADTEATELPVKQVTKAVNRIFRGGKNRTRPCFRGLNLFFDNEEEKELFLYGNVQGMIPYRKNRPGRFNGFVLSVGGTIFFLRLVNENCFATVIFRGNDRKVMHAFMVQMEEWVYIQDGVNLPVFWDGLIVSTARRSKGPDGKEMPIGTIMCEAHGRLFVSNQYNQIAASDVMFGQGFTDTKNVQRFTENRYWQEGGYFTVPTALGPIGGMIVMPAYGANLRGMGELLAFGSMGAMSFDVSIPRLAWKDAQIQKTAMAGRGCMAPASLIAVNGDVWYRSEDGWASYTNDRIDLSRKTPFRKFTREVNNWLDDDSDHLIRYACHIFHDNRILGTVSPFLSLPRDTEKFGSHRYFRGMIALDLDQASGLVGGEAMNFDGLWTGIRPTVMVKFGQRAFAMSYDADGVNRLYEITRRQGYDNGKRKIRSFYVTRRFAGRPSGSSEFQIKRLECGEIWLSEVVGRTKCSIDYRPNNSPCWQPLMEERQTGYDKPLGGLPFVEARTKRWKIETPDPDKCAPGTEELSATASEHQYLIKLEGNAKVDRMRMGCELQEDALIVDNCNDDPEEQEPVNCATENDYEYLIVENG